MIPFDRPETVDLYIFPFFQGVRFAEFGPVPLIRKQFGIVQGTVEQEQIRTLIPDRGRQL
jgi:hypothetical protein